MNKKGLLIVLIGPSGSGKGTVLKEVLKEDDNTFLSVSATTRKPRVGEIDGLHYIFIEKTQFEKLIETQSMLEYACYCDNYYGTPKATVLSRINNGQNVILEIEMQGAKQIKEMYPDAITIFTLPPSIDVLEKRLTQRGTEDQETIQKRLKTAIAEIGYAKECDFIVVNDEIEEAVDCIKSIIKAQSCKTEGMKSFLDHYLHS